MDCGSCITAPACGLTGALAQALGAFMKVLDEYTLENLINERLDMTGLFELRRTCRSRVSMTN